VSTIKGLGAGPQARLVKVALIALLLITSVLAPAVAVSAETLPWRGEYYNNMTLSGAPTVVRNDANINFDWGNGSPVPGINADRFSVHWTSYLYFEAGNYTFYMATDDGSRVWVDDQLLIDKWFDQPVTTHSAVKYLSAGYHSLRYEYYDNTGQAVAKLWWERTDGGSAPTEWVGQYYNNTWLGGTPAVTRNEAAVNFDWGYGSPAAGVNTDYFSARWQRTVYLEGGNYTFSATVDDGVRVFVNGALVIDKWYPQSRTTHTATLYLAPGNHQLRVEYFEQTGTAVCIVSWTGSAGQPPAQEVIVDNRDAGFSWGGTSAGWYARTVGFRGHLNWTWNSYQKLNHWGKWTPNLPQAGTWDVYVYVASRYFGSKSARYKITHANGVTERVVNQNIYNDQWVNLGSYTFSSGTGGNVYLGDATGETYATRFVGFDAVKFVRQGGGAPPPPPPPPGCAITPILGFGRVWNTYSQVRTKIGCATEVERSVWAAEQPFQGGYMYWRDDTKTIYVLYNNGTWAALADTWVVGEPETDPNIVPPFGFYQPKRGFGKVWRNSAELRNVLGWATTEERGFTGSVQPFQNGMMLWSTSRGILVLYSDNRWERFD
jgi:hypothetical protein